jgi:hypothetical protein
LFCVVLTRKKAMGAITTEGVMSGILPQAVPVAKGMVPYCLDVLSRRADAGERLRSLLTAIEAAAPEFRRLEEIFDRFLVSPVIHSEAARAALRQHLRRHWFDRDSAELWFTRDTAKIYAEGVMKALRLSLTGGPASPQAAPKGLRPAPIDGWWLVDAPAVTMITMARFRDIDQKVAESVNLLIMTPRPDPDSDVEVTQVPVMGRGIAEAYVTDRWDGRVMTKPVNSELAVPGVALPGMPPLFPEVARHVTPWLMHELDS